MNQLDRIMEVTGRPSAEDVEAIKSPFAATMLESLPMSRPKPLSDMFPQASVEALDLLRLCLQFNPSKRISAHAALRHPYVVEFHKPEEEPECDRVIQIPIDDNKKLKVEDYRERLYGEVMKRRKEQRRSVRRTVDGASQPAPQERTASASASGYSSGHHSSSGYAKQQSGYDSAAYPSRGDSGYSGHHGYASHGSSGSHAAAQPRATHGGHSSSHYAAAPSHHAAQYDYYQPRAPAQSSGHYGGHGYEQYPAYYQKNGVQGSVSGYPKKR
jgi:mitogen-activated protein kinase 15